jgi:hypothetical protein
MLNNPNFISVKCPHCGGYITEKAKNIISRGILQMIDTEKDIMDVENLDHVVVNEEGEEVVELQLDEFKAITEALQMYQKENSLQDVHISQLKDMVEKLEKENDLLKEKIQKLEKSSSKRQSVNKNIKIITDHLY